MVTMTDHEPMRFGRVAMGLCRVCNADRFPAGYGAPDRISPAHFSVRFEPDPLALRVYLDGEQLDDCEECMVVALDTPAIRFTPVYCVCGRYLCKASPGSWIEVKCPSCKRVIVMRIAEE